MKLYQINENLYPDAVAKDWQNSLVSGDAIFFMEAGVLWTQQQTLLNTLDQQGIVVFYRQTDLDGYGITPSVGHGISDIEWVQLTTRCDTIVSW